MDRKTDYDRIASEYDGRYERRSYSGIAAVLGDFVQRGQRVLEVGCGSGHWLAQLVGLGCRAVGLEPSQPMLERARARGLPATLVCGRAESLPFARGEFDRVVCINAIHHFADVARFIAEARRVLGSSGRLLSIALDPSLGRDRWSIYDYFAPTLELDRARYPKTAALREQFAQAGFTACETAVAEHIVQQLSAREALAGGWLAKSATSQLAILSDAEYETGLARIHADLDQAEARGEELMLTTDLYLYATFGNAP
jgi:ubiquinone/menaquinone biosynthesis C-methylase UbiE